MAVSFCFAQPCFGSVWAESESLSSFGFSEGGKAPMSWHSKKKESYVYHNNNDCWHGNDIETKYRVSGTGGKQLCAICEQLNKKKASKKK